MGNFPEVLRHQYGYLSTLSAAYPELVFLLLFQKYTNVRVHLRYLPYPSQDISGNVSIQFKNIVNELGLNLLI
jgi:hypothetical protein